MFMFLLSSPVCFLTKISECMFVKDLCQDICFLGLFLLQKFLFFVIHMCMSRFETGNVLLFPVRIMTHCLWAIYARLGSLNRYTPIHAFLSDLTLRLLLIFLLLLHMCEKVLAKLKEYGVEGIDEMTLDEDPNNEGMNCGHAFLDFVVHNDAVKAFKRLSKPDAVFGCDRSARIAWAEASDEPDETVLARVGQSYYYHFV